MSRFARYTAAVLLTAFILPISAFAQDRPAAEANQEPADAKATAAKPASPSLAQVEDVAGLPRVLLVGDSISMGYTLAVRAALAGRANVHRPAENCGDTARGIEKMDEWLGQGKWDVIHFNFGLHDLKYLDKNKRYTSADKGAVVATPEVYAENLRKIVTRLKQTGATLIFATTTPVPSDTTGRIEGSEKIYNEKALKVMKELGVQVDDLGGYVHAFQAKLSPMPPKPATGKPVPREGDIQRPYNVHFSEDGYKRLAGVVVTSLEQALPSLKKNAAK